MTGILFEYDHMLIKSEYRTPDIHAHLASHLIIGIDREISVIAGDEKFKAEGVFIDSDVDHTIYADKGEMLVYLFDSTTSYTAKIRKGYLKGKAYCKLLPEDIQKLRDIWKESRDDLKTADHAMLSFLKLAKKETDDTDERVREVLEILKEMQTIPENIVPKLCENVHLSKSRLSHLFKESMRISMHRYIALDKMKKGYLYYLRCGNITEAAMMAGFDSPSHFAATCKRMFGISFSEFVKS